MCIWAKTKKKLVENLWVDICDHGLANSFLDIVQRISKKRKIDKLDFIKIENVFPQKTQEDKSKKTSCRMR